ncbi:choice-of-anchor M domain-containing protein [Streptomyces halstedii]|uniref:choice-of-anchor M domain-containing protein n=1 Tax=Streptomyces halstedii TaxID=1944 RepID=UPI0036A3FE7F
MGLPTVSALRRARHTFAFLSLGGVLALTVAAPAQAATGPADGRRVLGAGQHVDAVYPVVEDGGLHIRTLTDKGEAEPKELALHIPDTKTSRITLPEEYGFLGKPGSDAWLTSQTQDMSVVWPGWSFEGIGSGVLKGTVSIALDGFSYAGEGDAPTFAVTQPGGFGNKKVSQLLVPGSAFTTVSGEVGSHTHANWLFTDQGTYDIDLSVHATLSSGKAVEDSTTVRFIVGPVPGTQKPPVEQKVSHYADSADELLLTPSKVDAEYFVGQTINLTAASTRTDEQSEFRWHVKKKGDSSFTPEPEQNTAVYSAKPDRALDGTRVYAELLDGGKVVQTSEPTTLRVQAHKPTTRLTVTADRSAYEDGDTAHLTSTQDPKTADEHYHWYLKRQGQDAYEWIEESRLADQDVSLTPELDGAQVVARLFDADHAVLAESSPITLAVGARSSATTVSVEQDAETHTAGGTATFTARVANAGPDATVVWSVRKSGENPFTEIAGAKGLTLEHTLPADWDGAQLRATVTQGGSEVVAEGGVPVLKVSAQAAGPAKSQEEGGSSPAAALWWSLSGAAVVAVLAVGVLLIRRRARPETVAPGSDERV